MLSENFVWSWSASLSKTNTYRFTAVWKWKLYYLQMHSFGAETQCWLSIVKQNGGKIKITFGFMHFNIIQNKITAIIILAICWGFCADRPNCWINYYKPSRKINLPNLGSYRPPSVGWSSPSNVCGLVISLTLSSKISLEL